MDEAADKQCHDESHYSDDNRAEEANQERLNTNPFEDREARAETDRRHGGAEQIAGSPNIADLVSQVLPGIGFPYSKCETVEQHRIADRSKDCHPDESQYKHWQELADINFLFRPFLVELVKVPIGQQWNDCRQEKISRELCHRRDLKHAFVLKYFLVRHCCADNLRRIVNCCPEEQSDLLRTR